MNWFRSDFAYDHITNRNTKSIEKLGKRKISKFDFAIWINRHGNAYNYFFAGIFVGAFAQETIPITFYENSNYNGKSRTMEVLVGTPEGSPCGHCYDFNDEIARTLQFRQPGSIEVPPGHYIRLYENFECFGDHLPFCGIACRCNSSHIDRFGSNYKCFITNAHDNFCPGGDSTTQYCHTESGCYIKTYCYGDQPGLYSFSVHKMPAGQSILGLDYPITTEEYTTSERCTTNNNRIGL